MKERDEYRIAVVTGGASGIGFSIAKKFVSANIRTVLIGRDATRLKLACETLGEHADFISCDLAQLDEIPGVVRKIKEKH
jgi:NADP-dependent 3-hydroxy acid dehydrogenase YdfG